MAIFAVCYDLNKPGQDYKDLYNALQSFGGYMHYLDSTWFISSNLSASQIFGKLSPFIDNTDNLLIIEVTNHWYAKLPQEGLDWLSHLLP